MRNIEKYVDWNAKKVALALDVRTLNCIRAEFSENNNKQGKLTLEFIIEFFNNKDNIENVPNFGKKSHKTLNNVLIRLGVMEGEVYKKFLTKDSKDLYMRKISIVMRAIRDKEPMSKIEKDLNIGRSHIANTVKQTINDALNFFGEESVFFEISVYRENSEYYLKVFKKYIEGVNKETDLNFDTDCLTI